MKSSNFIEFFTCVWFGIFQVWFQMVSAEGANMCGTPKADPAKTCVSIRLPWQEEPIYFCVEKEKIKYTKQCSRFESTYCREIKDNMLLLATPWDCCPMSSVPDLCEDAKCPPKPFNRTCTSLATPENDMDCCEKHFCEDGTPGDCNFKVLEPACGKPKNKTNCLVFTDPHGCCPKYQCDGEGKPGVCPATASSFSNDTMEAHSDYFYPRYHSMGMVTSSGLLSPPEGNSEMETADSTVSGTPSPIEEEVTTSAPLSSESATRAVPVSNRYRSYRHRSASRYSRYSSLIACVGDFTCPGTMKCCHSPDKYGAYDHYSVSPINQDNLGYCVEPAASK